jgi:hypothetical protein
LSLASRRPVKIGAVARRIARRSHHNLHELCDQTYVAA